MSYILLIVESPAKCEKIEKFLGAGYKVIGSYGHITHLSNLDQIDIKNNYKPSFAIIDTKKPQIEKMRKAIKGAKEVILATDDDREGEAIAWHIAQVFGLPLETKRIVFHEITERAIKHSLANPRTLNLELVYAQQARQSLDLIVGFTITPLLWKYIVSNSKNALSAGRCQTPALRLVYDNYKEILECPGKLSFNSCGYFTSKNIQFTLNKNFDSHDTVKDFLEQSKTHKHSLTKAKERELIKNPPCPFTTSGLQQAANNVMHISPKDTMALAQKLYEGGYITYMRTDSKVYSIDFIEQGKKYITEKYRPEYIHPELNKLIQNKDQEEALEEALEEAEKKTKAKKTKAKSKKEKSEETSNNNAQEAHEAIRPTHIELEAIPDNEETFSAKHRKLYKLIWTNSLESMMAPAKYLQLVVNVCAPFDAVYKYSAEENIFLGWKAVCGIEEEKYYNYLKNIKEEIIAYKKITCKQTLKELKSHYSEAHLVQLLEQKGIGRPSTFSSLLEKIQERNYVTKQNVEGKKLEIIDYTLVDANITQEHGSKEFGNEKNKLVITQTGIFVIEFLIKYFNKLFDYDYTKSMEDELDNIAHGQKKYYELCDECYCFINDLIKTNNLAFNNNSTNANANANSQEKFQLAIDSKHSYLIGKHGPTIKYTKEDGSLGFYGVKKDIDVTKLKEGGYKLEELIETKEENSKLLGSFQEQSVYLKKGKYGYFLECGELRKSLNTVKINVPIKEIKLEDALTILNDRASEGNSLVRKISNDLAIRKGKYGDYIFYKTETMKKPQFLKLNEFKDDYTNCSLDFLKSWIKEKYGL